MNICDPRHEPQYQIKYNPARNSNYVPTRGTRPAPVWLVCEACMQKSHFGSEDQVQSMEMLNNMTSDVLSKIKQQMEMLA